MVNATQNSSTAASVYASLNPSSTTNAASAAAGTQDRFLKLLVTQMKNQDPLNPMDNAQVTSQMAQLSTVTGIDKLNTTLQALSDSMTSSSNQTLQATNMIGHGVMVPGSNIDLTKGAGYGGFELGQSVDKLDVAIYDKAGALVRNISLGAQSSGVVNWQWDGRDNSGAVVKDGSYTFSASAAQAGNKVDATALQFGMVSSVTQGKQGVSLTVGQWDNIALSQVKRII